MLQIIRMDLKYSKIVNQGQKVTMLLTGIIGKDLDGNYFASELNYHFNNGIKDFTILINSVGGNVFHGYSIVGTIDYLQKQGANIELKNIGAAYSMAGCILACGQKGKRKGLDYSNTMLHDPMFSESEPETESEIKMISDIKNSLATIIANGCGKSKEDVMEIMSKETFMTSDEAYKYGIIDYIEKTNVILNVKDKFQIAAQAQEIYNNSNKLNNEKMVLNQLLKLNAEASETAQVEAVKELIGKADKVRETINELAIANNKITSLENQIKDLKNVENKLKAESLINENVLNGKIAENAKDIWVENAIKDYEGTEKMLKSIVYVVNISTNITVDNEKELAEKYATLVDNGKFKEIDALPLAEKQAMQNAFDKFNKVQIIKEV